MQKWSFFDTSSGFTDLSQMRRKQIFHTSPDSITVAKTRHSSTVFRGNREPRGCLQGKQQEMSPRVRVSYIPGESDNRIAMFPEHKDVRDEMKNFFKGQRVKGEGWKG